ncbi:hypothetical protein LSH36_488g02029 [Paralvinella palmiformis]|uniref:G-protein coupled receptors family 1 profile domain-containing protein n=1 Tax=Paralvinella palmiformis TaxID=53620 RepID=A0AAD9MWQ9_9ANNE|nr:hypothetical protein LSH36_488g02029 [Paralvinella palmiformis]
MVTVINDTVAAATTAAVATHVDPTSLMNQPLTTSRHHDSIYDGNLSDLVFMTTNLPEDVPFPDGAWKAFEVIHALFTITALVINCLSLGVIYGIVMRLTPPLQMLTSLGFADMLAPWAVMTLYFPDSACQHQIHSALMLLAHNASALTLLVYPIVHNIATYRPLQYEKIVTQRRTWITINLIWIVSIVTAHLHFLAVFLHQDPRTPYCDQVQQHFGLALIMTAAILATTVFVVVLTYGRLYLHLRPLEAIAGNSTEPRHSTKGVITGILLVAVFLIGWGPFLIAKLEQVRQEPHLHPNLLIGLAASEIFVLLMSIIHPVIYGMRMTNMYTGYYRLYQRTRACIVTMWYRARNKTDGDDQPSTPLNPIESIC